MSKEVTLRQIIKRWSAEISFREIFRKMPSGYTPLVDNLMLRDLKQLEKRIVDFEEIRDCSDEEFRGMMFVCNKILGEKAKK